MITTQVWDSDTPGCESQLSSVLAPGSAFLHLGFLAGKVGMQTPTVSVKVKWSTLAPFPDNVLQTHRRPLARSKKTLRTQHLSAAGRLRSPTWRTVSTPLDHAAVQSWALGGRCPEKQVLSPRSWAVPNQPVQIYCTPK